MLSIIRQHLRLPEPSAVLRRNVGGVVWTAVWPLLNRFARVPVCGLISSIRHPTAPGPDRLPATMRQIFMKSLTLRGFVDYEFMDL
jgi:hypothetical protein